MLMVLMILIILGLCFGSFVEALTWRIHKQTELKGTGNKKAKKGAVKLSAKDISMTRGRSMCAECHHTLAWYDLVPLFSWLSLKGKCRYCRKSIGWHAPLLELLMASLFVGSYLWWPLGFQGASLVQFGFWLVFLVGFVALALYDLRWMLLPDRITRPLIGLGLLQGLVLFILNPGWHTLTSIIGSCLIAGGIFYVLFQVSRGRWIGGGDVKLGLLIGLVLGQSNLAFMMLFGASVLGTIYSAPLVLSKRLKKDARIPFGPFLIAAAILVRIFGQVLINWYLRIVL